MRSGTYLSKFLRVSLPILESNVRPNSKELAEKKIPYAQTGVFKGYCLS